MSIASTIIRKATRKDGKLNILTFPTHERYQTNLAKTGHSFYLWQGQGIKPWVDSYAPLPKGTHLLTQEGDKCNIPMHVDIDLVFSQNKFGQFEVAKRLSDQIGVPLVSLEHTLPAQSWTKKHLNQLYNLRGDVNVFISEYSRAEWGWREDEAMVVHHGIDTELFKPSDNKREPLALSVVNDWINRDWCCGFKLWQAVSGFPDSYFPVRVIGDTPGLSEAAKSTEDLVKAYQESAVFLNTSLISPVPTSLLEAMSCGCAVVSTATCMIPEVINNGENGFMGETVEELKEYVELLISDESLRKKIGDNARKTIVDRFNIKDFVKSWDNVFLGCLE